MNKDNYWTLLDILRVFSGVLLLNAILSYLFTSSTLWGLDDSKYVDLHYWHYVIRGSPLIPFTIDSLRREVEDSGRLLLSFNKKVYDVSRNPDVYDPSNFKARYSTFVGRDCTRMFLNGCFHDENQCTWDLRNIGFDADWVETSIEHWEKFYSENRKYWLVGYLEVEEDRPVPEKCMDGMRYPN